MALALNNLRKGKKYRLQNYDEVFEFQVTDILEAEMFQLKDLHTMETYMLHELIQYGKGKDFDLQEL
jgi:hypothetical protein